MATSVAGKGWQCLLEVVWARMEDAGRRPGSSFGAISTAGTMQLMPALCCRAPDFPGLLQVWRKRRALEPERVRVPESEIKSTCSLSRSLSRALV